LSWTEAQIRQVMAVHEPYAADTGEDWSSVHCAGCPPWTSFDENHLIDKLKELTDGK
jgi:hypothetical protein